MAKTKSQFSKNIRALRTSREMTQKQLAEKLGIQEQTIIKWEGGSIEKPRQRGIIDSIKEQFGVSEQDLFGFADGYYAKLHGLTDAPAGAIAPVASGVLVPLLGTTHMGDFEDEGECERTVEVPASVADAHPGCYAVHAEGSCMDNRYPPDAVLLIDADMQPFDGCAVLAETVDYESVVRVYRQGSRTLMLSPDSHTGDYEDIIVKPDDPPVVIKGVVVWYQAEKDVREGL